MSLDSVKCGNGFEKYEEEIEKNLNFLDDKYDIEIEGEAVAEYHPTLFSGLTMIKPEEGCAIKSIEPRGDGKPANFKIDSEEDVYLAFGTRNFCIEKEPET